MTHTHATPNVDAGEIAHFDKLASSWWEPRGDMGPLHAINPPRVRFIEQAAGRLQGLRAVDVGCGGGLLTEALALKGAKVLGIDLATEALAVARRHAAQSALTIDYREIAAEALADEAPESFDLVTCLEMLEHVPDPESIVRACARLAKPGATVVFSTINRNPKSFALAIVAAEYVARLIAPGTHDYSKFIKPSELTEACRAAGLQPVVLKGLRYNPLLRTGSLADDIDVNYLLHCRKPAT